MRKALTGFFHKKKPKRVQGVRPLPCTVSIICVFTPITIPWVEVNHEMNSHIEKSSANAPEGLES